MRRLLFTFACLVAFVAPCAANQCAVVEAESFIAAGMEDVTAHPDKHVVIRGAQAAAFKEALGTQAEVLAAFLLDDAFIIIVMRGPDGVEAACFGQATDAAHALFKRILGEPA